MLTACGEDDKPDDPKPATPAATFTDGAGKQSTLSAVTVFSVTATPTNATPTGLPRRAFVVRAELPGGGIFDVTYTYLGSKEPTATGALTLDGPVRVQSYTPPAVPATYQAPTSNATFTIDSTTPLVVSGTYAGSAVAGGPVVKFAFTKATL